MRKKEICASGCDVPVFNELRKKSRLALNM